jgi:hypothetical protein
MYDTIKEFKHLDQILKKTKMHNEIDKELDKYIKPKHIKSSDKNYFTTYTKNGIEYNPITSSDGGINAFWGSNWKSVDTIRKANVEVITFLEPHTIIDSTKPKKQQKTFYSYAIKGQRTVN